MDEGFQREVELGQRFEFGENWRRFLSVLDESRIAEAERSLREMLEVESLAGRSFLDIGCGSGLFSLAAMRLGAAHVHSFDYDPSSVGCALELQRRYFPDDARWQVERGSVLDAAYLGRLPLADVVYSWGVLHHTGAMWQALENASQRVAPGGTFFIAIYNDQGRVSKLWTRVKRLHNRSRLGRWLVRGTIIPYWIVRGFFADLIAHGDPSYRYRNYRTQRGMSIYYDWVDWLGGYPFEVARPEQIFDLFRAQGFALTRLKTMGGGLGCNEFVFRKQA